MAVDLLRAIVAEAHPSDAPVLEAAFAGRHRDPSDAHSYKMLAIEGLSRIDQPESLSRLCAWATGREEPGIRRRAAVALRRFPNPRAVRCMVDALEDLQGKKERELYELVRALEEVTGQPLGADVKAWRTLLRSGLGLGAGIEGLEAGLQHASPAVRVLAARRLGEERAGLAALHARLPEETDGAARLALLEAIEAQERRESLEPLLVELERGRGSIEERVVLARALDRLGDGRGTLSLVADLDNNDPAVRRRAALALSEVTGEPPSVSPAKWRAWWKTYAERYRRADLEAAQEGARR